MTKENELTQLNKNTNLIGKNTFYKNIDQEIIVISEDKARLLLRDYQSTLRSKRNWVAPATTGASLLTAVISVDKFKDKFSIPAATWEAIIYIGLALTFIWLCYVCVKWIKHKNKGGIDFLVTQLKREKPSPKTKNGTYLLKKFKGIFSKLHKNAKEPSTKGGEP